MLALIDALRVAPLPPRQARGAFDPPCASRPRHRRRDEERPATIDDACGASNKELLKG
jgi:hypothetical protein